MPAFVSPHSSPYARLVSNVTEDGECWIGTEKARADYGYVRANFYVPGLRKVVHFSSHILTWVAHETGAATMDDLFLAYWEFRCSGLQLDHECNTPACRRPGHLEPVTQSENILRANARRSARSAMPDLADCEF